MNQGWKAGLDVPQGAVPAVEAALEALDPDDPPVLTSFEVDENSKVWRTEAYFAAAPDRTAIEQALTAVADAFGFDLPELNFAAVEDRDWVAESQR